MSENDPVIWKKMNFALWQMMNGAQKRRYRFTSMQYERARETHRKNVSEKRKAWWALKTKEERTKIASVGWQVANKRRKEQPPRKLKVSKEGQQRRLERIKELWVDPEWSAKQRARMSERNKRRYHKESERKKASEHFKRMWKDPEKRAQISAAISRHWEDPEYKAKVTCKGERNGRASVTEEQVLMIRDAWSKHDHSKRGSTHAFIEEWAVKCNTTPATIYFIVKGGTWKHLLP